MAVDEREALRVVFTLQLPRDPEESDVRNVTEWIDSLDKKVGPELSSAYRANSTIIVFECDKATCYALEGKEGFNFVGEVFGTNLRKQEQGPSVNCRQTNHSKRRGALWVQGRAEGQEYHRM